MKNNFYDVGSKFANGSLELEPIEPFDEIEFMYSLDSSNKKYAFKQIGGKNSYDFLLAGFSFIYLISSRVKNLLLENGFTGWKEKKVEVYSNGKKQLADYSGLAIVGKCGPIINELSVKKQVEPPVSFGNSYEAYFGLYFDEKSWDGSDIFSPTGKHNIFVTEKVRNVLVQHNVSNIDFTPISDVENMML